MKLNLGCGPVAPDGWVNIDGSWGAYARRIPFGAALARMFRGPASGRQPGLADAPGGDIAVHDLRKPLPYGNDSVSAIYASHVLEHLYLAQADRLLRECNRVLVRGGVLRVVVPDLENIVAKYIEEKKGSVNEGGRDPAADNLNLRMHYCDKEPKGGNILYRLYTFCTDFHAHKWMYDGDSLSRHFSEAGFGEVKIMGFRESRIEGIEAVELAERVVDGAGVCVEGIKGSST